MQGSITPYFFIFALYAVLILWTTVRYFSDQMGRGMKNKTSVDGQAYFFSTRRYNKYGNRVTARVGVPLQNGFVFSIWPKTRWHRFLGAFGLAQGILTGAPALDEAFYFMADDVERFKALLGTQSFITVLRQAFDANRVRDIECTQGRLWFNTLPVSMGGVLQVQAILGSPRFAAALQDSDKAAKLQAFENRLGVGQPDITEEAFVVQAQSLGSEVEKLQVADYPVYGAPSRTLFRYRVAHAALLIGSIVLLTTLLFRDEDIINTKDFFLRAGSLAPIVLLLWLGALISVLGRTSWFPRACSNFFLCGLPGLVLLTGFGVRELNIDFDHSAAEIKILQLQSKSCSLYCTTGGKHAQTMTYRLTDYQCARRAASSTIARYKADDYRCQHSAQLNFNLFFPWPTERTDGGNEFYKLPARLDSYEKAQAGESFAFPIHKGFLGLAWMRKNEIRPE